VIGLIICLKTAQKYFLNYFVYVRGLDSDPRTSGSIVEWLADIDKKIRPGGIGN